VLLRIIPHTEALMLYIIVVPRQGQQRCKRDAVCLDTVHLHVPEMWHVLLCSLSLWSEVTSSSHGAPLHQSIITSAARMINKNS
jgi:hypothetical protein